VSKRAHLINMRRIIAEVGAVDDVDTARREAVRADGYLEVNPNKRFEFDDQSRIANIQHINEAIAEVKTEIENFGPNPALIGQGIENKSGRAIALLQQAGIAELGPGIISFRDWKIRVYRAVWNAIRKHWTAQRWIRVTDEEGAPRFMGLNVMQVNEMGMPSLMSVGQDGQPMAQGGIDELDVDIMIDEGPDTLNVMQDTFETLQALAQNGAQVPPDVLIMASNLPASEKKKILERMEKANQPSEFDQKVMGIKVEEAEGKARKVNAEADKISAEAKNADATATRDRASAFKDVASAAMDIAGAKQPGGDMAPGQNTGRPNAFSPAVTGA